MLTVDLSNGILREDMEAIYRARKDWEELDNASVYVSGAAGMVASYFVLFLIYLNEYRKMHIRIYAGVRSREKARRRYGGYMDAEYFHILKADVCLPVQDTLSFDYIVHAASPASPQFYGSSPVEVMLPNIIGSYELLKYSLSHDVKGILFLSTGSVYGSISNGGSIGEDATGIFDWLAPGNEYGESKRCGEALCKAYFHEYGTRVKMARIFHTYGATMDVSNDKRVFSEFVANILDGENIVLKSEGMQKRAFCYIADAISAICKILLDGADGEAYNIGCDKEYVSIRELAEKLVSLFPDKNLSVIHAYRDDIGYVASPEYQTIPLSVNKLEGLGWNARYSIEEGFFRTIMCLQEANC